MDPILTPRPIMGFSSLQPQALPDAPVAWDEYKAKQAREADTTTSDYVGSMWRQDGITDGLIAHIVGQQMVPDSNYSPYAETEWKSLTEGVWPEFKTSLGQATSAAHAQYLKDLILQKQKDLVRLGDLGVAGNVGRLALGVLNPENLAMGYSGALVSKGLKAAQVARAAAGAADAVGEAAAVAGVRAAQAKSATGLAPIASGMAVSGAENAVFEKMRQSVNFEDDSSAVLEAGLIGLAFPLPFELAGARNAKRVATAAEHEHTVMKAIDKVNKGEALNANEARIVDRTIKASELVSEVEAGRMTVAEARSKLDSIHGPELEDAAWLGRYGESIAEDAQRYINEAFPLTAAARTRKNPGQTDFLQLGYSPESINGPLAPAIKVDPAGNAVLPGQSLDDPMAKPKGMSKLNIEAAIRREADKRFPKDQAKASEWATEQRLTHLGHPLEVATPIAKTKAAKKLSKALGLMAKEKAKVEVAPKSEAPTEAPISPVEAPKAEAPADPTIPLSKEPVEAVAPAAPEAPKVGTTPPKMGETVSWTNRKTGDQMYGVLESVREDGWYKVLDEDGKLHPIHPSSLVDLPPPESFEPGGSVGAAQIAGTTIAPHVDVSTQTSRLNVGGGTKPPLRWDFFATLNRSESDAVRSLVFKLVKDPLQVDDKVAQAMTASEWKSHIKRTAGGAFHREVREAAREAAEAMQIPIWGKPAFYHEFHSLTSRLTRGDLSLVNTHAAIHPMLSRASQAQKKLYADLLDQMQRAGVKGAEELQPNEFYVNRVWNMKAIRAAEEKHGAANVTRLLADAINVPGLNGDVEKAAKFLHAVKKLEFSQTMQTMHLGTRDMGSLRTELARHGLVDDEIDTIVQTMFEAKEASGTDAGRAGNLKYRFDIGENMSMTLPSGELRVADLFENDSRVLADSYLNSVGGHIGMAKHDIFSEADWSRTINELTNESIQKGLKGVDEDVQHLQDIYSNIVGRPMSTQDFSKTARIASALRGYTRSVSLGQLGLTAAFEMKQAVGLMGFRAFFDQSPAFRGIISAMRNGYFPDDTLARDLEHMTGFGSEMSMSYARAQEVDDGFLGQSLNKFEDWSNKASHATDIMSGNASFTSLTRQLSSKMAAQRLSDFATGRMELTPKMRERLVGWGVDDDLIETLLEDLKQFSVTTQKGKLETIDWEAWRDSGKGTYDMFQTVNSRMVRDAIQDQDLGETIPFMHTTLGKVFGELKTFFLVAHAKNMLKNISYMDQTAFQIWAISFVGEALTYSMQTSMNFAGDQEKLDKMLTAENIAGAAISRSAVTGMLPFFANTGYQVATGGSSIPGMGQDMTASGNGRTFVPPSMGTVQRLWAAPSTAMGLILDNGNVTQKEGQDLYKTLPMSNIYGARWLGNYLSNSLPAREPPKQ